MAKYEIVTIVEEYPDQTIAKKLSDGWEIIWQDFYSIGNHITDFTVWHMIRFKRVVKPTPSYPTHYLCTEDGSFAQQIEQVKAVNPNAELWHGEAWQIRLDGNVIAEHNDLGYCLFALQYFMDQAVNNG